MFAFLYVESLLLDSHRHVLSSPVMQKHSSFCTLGLNPWVKTPQVLGGKNPSILLSFYKPLKLLSSNVPAPKKLCEDST